MRLRRPIPSCPGFVKFTAHVQTVFYGIAVFIQFLTIKTVWPSGLRRWLKAPFRKGVGSNPTAVTHQIHAAIQRLQSTNCSLSLIPVAARAALLDGRRRIAPGKPQACVSAPATVIQPAGEAEGTRSISGRSARPVQAQRPRVYLEPAFLRHFHRSLLRPHFPKRSGVERMGDNRHCQVHSPRANCLL